jgi:hypothetical protein
MFCKLLIRVTVNVPPGTLTNRTGIKTNTEATVSIKLN